MGRFQGSGDRDTDRRSPSTVVMTPDEAAWALMAGAAQRALTLPGLTAACTGDLEEMVTSCLRAAGQPA